MKYTIYLLLILGCISCKRDAIPSPHFESNNEDTLGFHTAFELVWHKRAESAQICRGSFVYEKGVVFFIQEAKQNSKDDILALDLETGDTLWIWSEGPFFTNHRYIVGNTLYFTAGTSVYALDCLTGKTLWQYVPPSHLAYMSLSVSPDGIYVSYQDRKPDPTQTESILFELDKSGQPTEVFRLYAKRRQGLTFNFDHVTPWRHPNGDKILFCESRSWNYGPKNFGQGEYLAINTATSAIYHDWKNLFDDIDIGGRCVIENDIVYVSSGWDKIGAINLITKETLWSTSLPETKSTASLMPLIMFNNNLLMSLGNKGHLNVVDKQSGLLSKTFTDIGTEWFSTSYKINSGLCWFTTTAGLFQMDFNFDIQLQLLNEEIVGTSGGSFTNGMDISINGYIYTTRGSDYVCLKLK